MATGERLGLVWAFKTSKLTCSDTLSVTKPQLLILQDSSPNWDQEFKYKCFSFKATLWVSCSVYTPAFVLEVGVLFSFVCLGWGRVSLCSSACPGTYYADQDLADIFLPLPASQALALKVSATTNTQVTLLF